MRHELSFNPNYRSIYTVVASNTNTSGSPVNCVIFGAGRFGISDKQEKEGARVVVQESSHEQLRAETLVRPFTIQGVRCIMSHSDQLPMPAILKKSSASGTAHYSFIKFLNYRKIAQVQTLRFDCETLEFDVNDQTELQIPVPAGQTMILVFYVKPKPVAVPAWKTWLHLFKNAFTCKKKQANESRVIHGRSLTFVLENKSEEVQCALLFNRFLPQSEDVTIKAMEHPYRQVLSHIENRHIEIVFMRFILLNESLFSQDKKQWDLGMDHVRVTDKVEDVFISKKTKYILSDYLTSRQEPKTGWADQIQLDAEINLRIDSYSHLDIPLLPGQKMVVILELK